MPHRLLGHPIQALFALAGFFMSFVASVAASMSTAAHGTTQTLFAVVDSTAAVSWAGTAVTVLAIVSPGIFKFLKGLRQVTLEQDTAEMAVWGKQIADANRDKGTAEGKLDAALERLAKLQALCEKQDLEIRDNRHAMRNLQQELELHKEVTVRTKATAARAGRVAQDSSNQVEALGQRVEAVEHVVASSSGVDFPSPPAVEPQNEGGAK